MAIEYGLTNIYYSTYSDESGYSTPVQLCSAADLQLDPVICKNTFTGLDGIELQEGETIGGYDGKISLYNIPVSLLCSLWGYQLRDDGLIMETATTTSQRCALLYESGGPDVARYLYYNVIFNRPSINLSTISNQAVVNKISIEIIVRADDNGNIRLICPNSNSNFSSWFDGVIT